MPHWPIYAWYMHNAVMTVPEFLMLPPRQKGALPEACIYFPQTSHA